MMYAAGDSKDPNESAAKYLEVVVKTQILRLLKHASKIKTLRRSKIIDVEDILFILRKQPGKMMRLLNFINTKNINDFIKGESFDEVQELNFCWILPGTENIVDREYQEKLKRVDLQTKGMSKAEYDLFAEARHASFTYKKSKKFRAFIRPYKAKEGALDILGVICSDIIYKLVYDTLSNVQPNSGLTADQIKRTCWDIVLKKGKLY